MNYLQHQIIHFNAVMCVEAEVQTRLDVLPQDPDVLVPVRAALFVVEAEGVEQLVLDGAVVQTALTAQRHSLTTTLTAHVGIAAVDT